MSLCKQSVSELPGTTELTWVHENPKYTGTASHARFEAYRTAATVDDFYACGGHLNDLKFDLSRGYVSLKRARKRPASSSIDADTSSKGNESSANESGPSSKTSSKFKTTVTKRKDKLDNGAGKARSKVKAKKSKRKPKLVKMRPQTSMAKRLAASDIATDPEDSSPGTRIKIACLGDSNTTSYGKMSYPAALKEILNGASPNTYEVQSFGVSGATAAATAGKKHYSSHPKCAKAMGWEADIYAVMLGTNDAWHGWGEPVRAAPGIDELIQSLRLKAKSAGRRQPAVLLVMAPGLKPGSLITNLSRIVHPAVRRLASQRQAKVVDAALDHVKFYKSDLVHLSSEGASRIATRVAAAVEEVVAEAGAKLQG